MILAGSVTHRVTLRLHNMAHMYGTHREYPGAARWEELSQSQTYCNDTYDITLALHRSRTPTLTLTQAVLIWSQVNRRGEGCTVVGGEFLKVNACFGGGK